MTTSLKALLITLTVLLSLVIFPKLTLLAVLGGGVYAVSHYILKK